MGKGGRPACGAPPLVRLVSSKEVLTYRAHNKWILNGFRQDDDTSIVTALFRVHGQTFNIWSHLAGTVLFVVPHLLSPSIPGAPWISEALRLHTFIAACCGLASAAFHIVESWSTRSYSLLLALDYTMAYAATVSHSFLIAVYETADTPWLCTAIVLPLVAMGAFGTHFFFVSQQGSNTDDPLIRIFLVMTGPFFFALPIVLKHLIFTSELTIVLLRWMLAFAVASAAWLLMLPERLFPPGTFDYMGNSHNVMHVMVLVVWQQLHFGIRALVESAA